MNFLRQIIVKIWNALPYRWKSVYIRVIKNAILPEKLIIRLTNTPHIDQDKKRQEIKDRGEFIGVSEDRRAPRLIVSLTTYPEREGDAYFSLYSLLNQTVKPDEVVLWLSHEEYPKGEDGVSEHILSLKKCGVTIKFCDNIKSYKKLVPSLLLYKDDIIVTADDDIYYPEYWLERLYRSYQDRPEYIHTHCSMAVEIDPNGDYPPYMSWKRRSAEGASYLNLLGGGYGVLYPPSSLHPDATRRDLFTTLCPTADDLWFWAMAVLNRRKINVVKDNISDIVAINIRKELGLLPSSPLHKVNLDGGGNDFCLKNILSRYGRIVGVIHEKEI